MFYEYFLNRFLISKNDFLTFSASDLTALLYVADIRRINFSAIIKISTLKSSLPWPSGLATEFIYPIIFTSFFQTELYFSDSIKILPLLFSCFSTLESSFSRLIASVMNLRASASINISSKTYSCSNETQYLSNSSRFTRMSVLISYREIWGFSSQDLC